MKDKEKKEEPDLTELMNDAAGGDAGAEAAVLDKTYSSLRALAAAILDRKQENSLDPSDVVGAAYEKLVRARPKGWARREAFFSYVARVMESIVIDRTRARLAQRRGSGVEAVLLRVDVSSLEEEHQRSLELQDAIAVLESRYGTRVGSVLRARHFAGLSNDEIAEHLGVSRRTVEREAAKAELLFKRIWKDR